MSAAEPSTSNHFHSPRRPGVEPPRPAPVPCLELVNERVLVDVGGPWGSEFEEVEAAALRLSFDYGDVRVPASDPGDRVFGPRGSFPRDRAAERAARTLLETYGPIEVGLDECIQVPGGEADYVIDLHDDADALCNFGAVAVPKLRDAGWRVQIAADFRVCVVEADAWYAQMQPDESGEGSGWFDLELGVEVDGERIDLLPLLLDLIEGRGDSLARFEAGGRRFRALPLGDGRLLAVPPERLASVVKVLVELYELDGATPGRGVQLPPLVPGYLEELERTFEDGELRWAGDPGHRARQRALLTRGRSMAVETPGKLQATLRPYQEEGLAWLQSLRAAGAGGVLADDMGLGKTLQTIAHLCAEHESGRADRPSLVVAPTSLVGNWQRELKKFAPHLRVVIMHGPDRHRRTLAMDHAHVVITTYPLVIRDAEVFARREFHLLILDEAHAIKNERSQAHAAARALEARHRLCITGTPVENNLEELRALFNFLMPGFLGDVGSFRSRYRFPIEKQGNAERLAQLRERIAPFILRRLKDQVVTELPPKTEVVVPVELRGRQRDLYESIRLAAHATVRQAVERKGIAGSTVDILGALMKLRQVCCDPRLVPVDAAREVEESAKYEAFFELLEELRGQGRRVLVFSQFARMLALLAQGLSERKVRHIVLTGDTDDRQGLVDAFQTGTVDVFLISLKAGGTGLNLTRADTVIHFDPWWNPAAERQATDRAYRIGQQNPVFVYRLIVSGSVEARMLSLQERKRALAEGILDAADDADSGLDAEDVESLFEPLED